MMGPERDPALSDLPNHPLLDETGLKPLRVLHLEDNDVDAAVFAAAANRSSRRLDVERVGSLAEFRAVLAERTPHLICADHLLPDGEAREDLRKTSLRHPDIPIIIITGAGEEEVAVAYLKSGAADYLSKQKLHLFPEALEQVLEKYRSKWLHTWSEMERSRLTAELLALVRRVELDRDEEKKSLSRDIHDQLGQELTALKLGLYWMDGRIRKADDEEWRSNPFKEGILAKIDSLVELNTSIIKQVRNIAHSLRPVVLDQVGLSAGLESLVHDFNRRESTFCGLHITNLPDLEQGLRTDIFRIVQEALTNISRHSDANLAYVRLQGRKGELVLEVGDDGKGMDSDRTKPSSVQGLGMVGMRERARNHDAQILVDSKKDMGTSITIRFALDSTS